MRAGRAVLAAVAMLGLLAGAAPVIAQGDSTEARLSALEQQLRTQRAERGARLFAGACAACHGRNGEGDGPAAADLDPMPRNLTLRHFRFRTTPNGAHPRSEDLARTIRNGLPGTAMPAFGRLLDEASIEDLVAFIHSLHPEETADGLPEPLELAPVPEAAPDAVRDGRAIYLLAGCWRCHGVNGDGRGPSAGTLEDDAGRKIRATDFRHDPFKGGRDATSVVRTLRTGLNGTPMPSYDSAMLIAREDTGDTASLEGRLDAETQTTIDGFLQASPTRAELEAMSDAAVAELRDKRMAALAHYVLSLDRRRGFAFRLFREEPEREARKP